jgi:hypothetical protein
VDSQPSPRSSTPLLIASIAVAVGASYLFYLLLGSGGPDATTTVSITFLLVLPAVLTAITSFLGDPDSTKGLGYHLAIPAILIGIIVLAGLILLQEGVICILMLLPLWIPAAVAGSMATYGLRLRIRERGRLFCTALLLVPLVAAQIEAEFEPATGWYVVEREVIVDTAPSEVWPHLVAIADIEPNEGRWNLTQDVLDIPRPVSASLERRGSKLIRRATWESGVRFEEHITDWRAGRSVEWAFAFPDPSVQQHTDQHIAPHGTHLRIDRGGYRLQATEDGRTRLRLYTRYGLRTPLNGYAAAWGELLLGDIQENVLAIVKGRAERGK